jgi:hypothetical protein
MRWVSTVTWFWVGLIVFMHGAVWLLEHATCKGEAAMGCGLVALMAIPVWGLTVLSIPFLFALWLARLAYWVSHRGDEAGRIGYVARPQAQVFPGNSTILPKPAPAGAAKPGEQTGDAGHRWLGESRKP